MPTLTAADLAASVPGLAAVAAIETLSPLRRPSAGLTLDDLIGVARTLRERLAGDLDGAVVIQGTDTIEETAFVLDTLIDGDKTVVVTAVGCRGGSGAAAVVGITHRLRRHAGRLLDLTADLLDGGAEFLGRRRHGVDVAGGLLGRARDAGGAGRRALDGVAHPARRGLQSVDRLRDPGDDGADRLLEAVGEVAQEGAAQHAVVPRAFEYACNTVEGLAHGNTISAWFSLAGGTPAARLCRRA